MASPPGAGGSRYVGRIVDPDVRDDGQAEPEIELNSASPVAAEVAREPLAEDTGSASTQTEATRAELGAGEAVADGAARAGEHAGSTPAAGGTLQTRGAAMRERLLERARASHAELPESMLPRSLESELEAIGRTSPAEGDAELELPPPPSAGRAPAAPLVSAKSELSPNLVALFAALLGIASIASLTALFMSLEGRVAIPKSALAPASAAAVTNTPPPAPEAPAQPKAKPKRQRNKQPGPWRVSDARADARYRFVEGKIGADAFLKAIAAAGVPEAQGYRVLAALRDVRDLNKCKKSDRFQALIDRASGRLFSFEYLVSAEEVYQAREEAGRLIGARLDLKVERARIAGALSYDGESFERSAELAGFDPGLSKVVAKALDGHSALDELERGDVLRLVAQEVTVLGDFARYAGVEALELLRADDQKGKLRVYYLDAPEIRGYYDHQGRAPFEGGWRKPIKDAPRTSPFNPKRLHPVLKKVMPHNGTDFGAPTGTPVGAASFGTVSFLGWGGPSGNLVKIIHPGGIETGYAHLSRFAEGLKLGDKVKRLQLIGYVGSTGRSTGPHLHFSASRNGKFFDPESLNLDGMRVLTQSERASFAPAVAEYDALLDGIAMPERYEPRPKPEVPAPAPVAAGDAAPEDEADEHAETVARAGPPALQGASVAAGAPAQRVAGGSSVYLSDKELLEAQSASDDGEVEE